MDAAIALVFHFFVHLSFFQVWEKFLKRCINKCEVRRPNFKFIFLYILCFLHFFIFLYFCTFVLLYFCTFCTFVLSHLVGRCIWTSMQNLESVALKMTELWVLLYLCTFLYFCTFFVRKWLRAVKIYLHAKCQPSSSKIERVMLNFVFCSVPVPCRASVPVTNLPVELCPSRQLII